MNAYYLILHIYEVFVNVVTAQWAGKFKLVSREAELEKPGALDSQRSKILSTKHGFLFEMIAATSIMISPRGVLHATLGQENVVINEFSVIDYHFDIVMTYHQISGPTVLISWAKLGAQVYVKFSDAGLRRFPADSPKRRIVFAC